MKKIFLVLLLGLAFLGTTSAQWDVTLPEYSVEAVTFPYAGQNIDWGVSYLKSEQFWVKSRGQGAMIFICDTGIETGHPDLKDRVVLQYARDFTGSSSGYQDLHGHGTHCAGIAAATNNEIGVVGNAPMAYLVPVKVLNDQGSGSYSWIAAGLRYVADLNLSGTYAGLKKVCSLSLGGGSPSTELEGAIDYAISKGVFIIVAAGNSGCNVDNTIGWPGRYPQCVTIASIGKTEQPSSFSSCGEQIDVAAPGENIYSCGKGGGYVFLSGTSMATPGVAGVVANIVSAYPEIKNQSDLEKFLRVRAKDISSTGWDKRTGYGAPVMTGYLTPPDGGGPIDPPPPPPTDPIRAQRNITIPVDGQFSFVWKASNETAFHRATVENMVVDYSTNLWAASAVKDAIEKTNKFFANGGRGFGLLDDADIYEAGRWAAFFLALITREGKNTIIVRGMTVRDESGNTIWFDGAKDKARDLPAANTIFRSMSVQSSKQLKKAARQGATTWQK